MSGRLNYDLTSAMDGNDNEQLVVVLTVVNQIEIVYILTSYCDSLDIKEYDLNNVAAIVVHIMPSLVVSQIPGLAYDLQFRNGSLLCLDQESLQTSNHKVTITAHLHTHAFSPRCFCDEFFTRSALNRC